MSYSENEDEFVYESENDKEDDKEDDKEVDKEDKKVNKKKNSLLDRLPSLAVLQRRAMENDIEYNDLDRLQLYNKLKTLELLDAKPREKIEKSKISLKGVVYLAERRKEDEERKKLFDEFKKEEKKRFDFFYSLYSSKKSGSEIIEELEYFIDENKYDRTRILELLKNIDTKSVKELVKKYSTIQNPLRHYSILLIHQILEEMKIELDSEEKQRDVKDFEDLEKKMMTKRELEKAERIKNNNDLLLQSKYLLKLKQLKQLIKEEEHKVKEDDSTDEQLKKYKEEKRILERRNNQTFLQENILRESIKQLEKKLERFSYTKQVREELDNLELKVNILLDNPFTIQNYGNIKGEEAIKRFLKEKITKKEKVEEEKKVIKYFENELEIMNKVYDILTQLTIEEDDDLFRQLKDLKVKYKKSVSEEQQEKMNYLASKYCLDESYQEKKQEISEKIVEVYLPLYKKIELLKFNPVIDEDQKENESQKEIRNMIRVLKDQLLHLENYERKERYTLYDELPDLIRLRQLKENLKLCKDEKTCEILKKLINEIEVQYGKKNIMSIDQMVLFLKNKLLSSYYDTKDEMDRIDSIILKYKIIDLDRFKEYKKQMNTELSVKATQTEISHHLIELKNLEDQINSEMNFDEYKKEKSKKDKKDIKIIENNCMSEFFKKPWVKNYTGIFYVHFINDIDFVNSPLIDFSYKPIVIDGLTFYRGTRYLDILLCSDKKKQEGDIVSIENYQLMIRYKTTENLLLNTIYFYDKELKWKVEKQKTFTDQLDSLGNKIVNNVRQDLSIVLMNELTKYFDKENSIHLKDNLLYMYSDKTVYELLERLGRLVIFLDASFMKEEARAFNQRLKNGYVKENEILEMDWTDIIKETIDKNELDIFNPDNLRNKVESFINFYVKRIVFQMLSANRIILKEKLVDPRIRYNKVYDSLSMTDCSNKNDILQYDIVYYINDEGIVKCYSLTRLLIEKELEKIDLKQKYNFSQDFLNYLEHFKSPFKEDKDEEIEIDLEFEKQRFFDELKELEMSILEKQDKNAEEYTQIFFKKENRDNLYFQLHGDFPN
jgi:hypothetical protein